MEKKNYREDSALEGVRILNIFLVLGLKHTKEQTITIRSCICVNVKVSSTGLGGERKSAQAFTGVKE